VFLYYAVRTGSWMFHNTASCHSSQSVTVQTEHCSIIGRLQPAVLIRNLVVLIDFHYLSLIKKEISKIR